MKDRRIICWLLIGLFCALDNAESSSAQGNSNAPVDQKTAEANHYESSKILVGYPESPLKPEERSTLSSTQDILHSMRMMGEMIWPKTAEEAEARAKSLKARGYNVVKWGERYFLADDPNEELPALLRGETLENKIKYAKIYIPALHRHGIKFLWQPTLPLVSQAYIKRNPKMATIDLRTGAVFEDAGYGTAMACPFNDQLLDDLLTRMERVLKEAGGDGVMFDDHQMFRIDHCACTSCQEKYKKRTGKDLLKTIPPLLGNGERNHPDMVEWFRWRADAVLDTYLRGRERVQKINPEIYLSTYSNANSTGGAYLCAGAYAGDQVKYADSIGMETEYPGNAYKYYWPLLTVESKYSRALIEKSNASFWTLIYNNDAPDLIIGSMIAFTQGINQWWIMENPTLERGAQPLINWREKHEKILAKPRLMANVGVPYSFASMHHTPNFKPRRWEQGYASTCGALTNAQIPYAVVLDEEMSNLKYLVENFQTLLMFDQYNVSEKQLQAIREFVRQGGTLIASGETSLYDETGKMRDNFGLSDLFGCTYQGKNESPSKLKISGRNAVTGDLAGEFEHREPFILVKEVSKEAQRIGTMKAADGKEYEGILAKKFGKGNVVYLTGNPALSAFYTHYNENRVERGKWWTDERIPGYDRLISRLASYENQKMPMVVNNGTTEILAEVYRHENGGMKGVQIRLANLLGSRIKSGVVPMDNTIDFPEVQSHLPNPSKPLSLSVRAPETKKAYMISLDYDALVELPFRIEKGVVEVEVPKLYRSALIYLSSGDDREILKIGGGKAVREVPKAKELVYMESTRLAKRASGPAITIFPETSAVKGGTARSFYRNEMSTFIYGAESAVNEMEVQFDSDLKLKNPLLEIGGMNDNAKVHATIEVTLNQERLFLGKTRFPSDEWGILSFPMKEIALKEKGNQLKIRIVGKGTHAGPPWFGVTYLRFQNDSK